MVGTIGANFPFFRGWGDPTPQYLELSWWRSRGEVSTAYECCVLYYRTQELEG